MSEEDKAALDRKLILIRGGFCLPLLYVRPRMAQHGLDTTVVSCPTALSPCLPQTPVILNSMLPVLPEPTKSSSWWCHFAVPSVINHSQATHKTPKAAKVHGRRGKFLLPPCVKVLEAQTFLGDILLQKNLSQTFDKNVFRPAAYLEM